jgi:hypothetical protein
VGYERERKEPTVEEVRDEDTNGDHDLEETGDASADVLGRALGDEGGRDGRDAADADTGDDTAGIDVGEAAAVTGDSGQDLKQDSVPTRRGD